MAVYIVPTASTIPTVERVTTCSTCQPLRTSGSIIGSYSPTSKTISTGLRISRTRQSVTFASSTVLLRLNAGYIWKNASGDLTTVTHWINHPKSNDELSVTSDSYLGQPQINKLISLAASQIDLSDFRLRGYGLMETFSNQDLFWHRVFNDRASN